MRWSCPGSFCPKRLCLRCLEDGSIQIKRHDWSLKTLCAIFCVGQHCADIHESFETWNMVPSLPAASQLL